MDMYSGYKDVYVALSPSEVANQLMMELSL